MSLEYLYNTRSGRRILKFLVKPGLSDLCGRFLDTGLSKPLIKPFIKKNNIDMSEYMDEKYTCFNDCFCRRIRPECRPVDMIPDHLPSPCDGLLSAYQIEDDMVIPVKGSKYSIKNLLRDENLANEFNDGMCLVFRLCVNHYHRYSYPDDGIKGPNIFIPGVLHTVRPVALYSEPVFIENSREYTVLNTQNFGRVVQMEVGAMLVGKISNNQGEGSFIRGSEKGKFLYGGSTIILLLGKNSAKVNSRYFDATAEGKETPIKLGESLS